jgi:hypothetical protein
MKIFLPGTRLNAAGIFVAGQRLDWLIVKSRITTAP